MKCKICGQEDCKKHSLLLPKRRIQNFSGSSPPEIFVGKWNYPNVYTGILAPEEYGNTEIMSSPEIWHDKKLSIQEILKFRNQLIYGRTQTNIKKVVSESPSKFLSTFQEISMTHKPVSTQFILKKPITINKEKESSAPLISHAAQIHYVRLEENPKIENKIDYLVNDTHVKSSIAINELSKSNIQTSHIIKLLSSGLLGMKFRRKLVPTRWAITAVDSNLSQSKIKKIKEFQEIQEIQVFSSNYLGNHYEFLLIPNYWSFEVIEISHSGGIWTDYETQFSRTTYADSVTGGYYANRLALTEYLERIRRQASCIVFREIRPEYSAPLGVGILRQTSREAFSKQPRKFNTIKDALIDIQTRIKTPIENYTDKSIILKTYKSQSRLNQFLKKIN